MDDLKMLIQSIRDDRKKSADMRDLCEPGSRQVSYWSGRADALEGLEETISLIDQAQEPPRAETKPVKQMPVIVSMDGGLVQEVHAPVDLFVVVLDIDEKADEPLVVSEWETTSETWTEAKAQAIEMIRKKAQEGDQEHE